MASESVHDRVCKAARIWGVDHGMAGSRSGWVYDPKGKVVAKGWAGVAKKYRKKIVAESIGLADDVIEYLTNWPVRRDDD